MIRLLIRRRLLFLPFLLNAGACSAQEDFQELGGSFDTEVLPILGTHCLDCHDAETSKGELDLERFVNLAEVRRDPQVWQKVVEQLENGEMPPKDEEPLSLKQRGILLDWTKGYLHAEALAGAGDPGPVTLRRLSNAEYTYTVRDLTGVPSLNPAAEFPVDSAAGEGFTNTGDALVMSPALLEKYLTAGKEMASHAVLLPDGFRFSRATSRRDWSDEILGEIRSLYAEKLQSKGVDFSYRREVGDVRPRGNGDGCLNYADYFEALIKGAGAGDLNPKYFASLERMLESEEQSFLMDALKARLRTAKPGDGAAIADWVRDWQDQLWKFNSVGARGLIRPWQEAVNPVGTRAELRVKLSPPADGSDLKLTLAAVGEGKVAWENPGIARPGKPLLMLRDLPKQAEVMRRYQKMALKDIEGLLGIAFRVKEGMGRAVGDDVDLSLLPPLLKYLGIDRDKGEYLTQRVENIAGQAAFQGWEMPGVRDLSFLGNGTDATHRIPGEVPAHRVVVHPRPERWIGASWKCPEDGTVKIEANVIDRHNACGNGVNWTLLSQGRVLRKGEIDNGGVAEIAALKDVPVKKGEMITLKVGARGPDHTCDLTEIELKITRGERVWSLNADCADTMGQGNPHADGSGNPDVWHFRSGTVNEEKPAVPGGSLLDQWLACDDAGQAASLAAKIRVLVGAPPTADTPAPDVALYQHLTDVGGPVLSMIDFSSGDGGSWSLNEKVATFSIPPALLADGTEFTASGRVLAGGPVQFHVVPGGSAPESWSPGVPVTTTADRDVIRAFDDFRELFPAAMCFARIVPIDEVVTLLLYHREDHELARLMLTDQESRRLDRLWEELRFVSQDAFQVVTGLEQILEFATQDGDPKSLDPLLEPIATAAKNLESQLAKSEPEHVEKLIEFAASVYRRPLLKREQVNLRDLYDDLRKEGLTHDESFRLLLARLFASPDFLYKRESPPSGVKQGPVSDWELATRLSYFLWSSAPDAELRELAATGELRNALIDQTHRMLAHPNSRRLAIEFGCQWLHIRGFDDFDEKSERHFPEFANLRGAMYEEAIQFFGDLFQNDGAILSLLDAEYSFVNAELADFYGIQKEGSDGWSKEPSNRGGILGMAATLAKQSGASRTSPILRGNWVYETLLGERLPRPPKGVPPLPETLPEGLSERALIEQHAADPACAKCHVRIDPYGFALEQFDAIGRARSGRDTKATVVDGTQIEGFGGLRDYLLKTRRDTVVKQFCRKLLGYALGRATRLSDEPLLDEMLASLKSDGYRVRTAVDAIVNSRQFLEIRGQ